MKVSGKIALLKRWTKIITGRNRVAIPQGVGKIYSKNEILGYYNDLTGKVNDDTLLDDQGIPLNLIGNGDLVYFPISIFQYALGMWDKFLLEKDNSYKNKFLQLAEWVILNQKNDGSWNCFGPIGYEYFSVSSMGQGEAISVMLRAYVCNRDSKWLDATTKAIEFMCLDVESGGTILHENGKIYLEEYPSIDENLSHPKVTVLNGWIFSLFGMYDYLQIIENEKVEEIYLKSIDTLKETLCKYDMGYWTYYDRSGLIASPAYHNLHVNLLLVLSDLTGEVYFKEIAIKWEQYPLKKMNVIRAVYRKIIQKMGESSEGVIIK
ncbi:D-glucuronyl C5-epimerase family protein [Tannockella kyphosi]|uniref:D-glucuronyl C5-epimerase family protein n=1 Tax=Tannockella kyphosi TaxID=2899121 RepID=UPI0020119D1B|nr:D-glucuronyl C5-epimerase family protein [Tannockella kyphosi]